MIKYKFTWKVYAGTGEVLKGEDSIITEESLTKDELIEKISGSISQGDDAPFGETLSICAAANTCDASCIDWKINNFLKKEDK